jgi:hypothetical protein
VLSEAEQRRLSEIESHLRDEDPTFVQRFDDPEQPRPWTRRRGLLALLVVAVALMVAGAGLVIGSVGTVVAALVAFAASAGMWVSHRWGP